MHLQNHPIFHPEERLVSLVRGRECFFGLCILIVSAGTTPPCLEEQDPYERRNLADTEQRRVLQLQNIAKTLAKVPPLSRGAFGAQTYCIYFRFNQYVNFK